MVSVFRVVAVTAIMVSAAMTFCKLFGRRIWLAVGVDQFFLGTVISPTSTARCFFDGVQGS